MKAQHILGKLLQAAFAALVAMVCIFGSVFAQTINNPSFETDSFSVFPGYITDNLAITGWTANDNSRAGLNPAGGSPFADNGAIPNGNNVAFLQWGGTGGGTELSTPISGLTVGTTYKVAFRVNARAGNTPYLRIWIDGLKIVDMQVTSVGEANPYKYVAFDFTATAASQRLILRNDAGSDNTVLVDDFSIAPSNGRWSFANWNSDASSGVDPAYTYTHAYNFGSAANAVVNGVTFTGISSANPSVDGQFSTAGFDGVFNDDGNNVIGGSRTLANDFIYGGPVHSITINGLTPGTEYIATIYGVGFDDSPGARAATFSAGADLLTVDDDHYGNNNGIRISYHYTADETGSIALSYVPTHSSSTFHTYGFCNREATKAALPAGLLLSDKFTGTGTPDTMNLNYNLIARQTSPLGLIGYTPSGNAQVGNTGEPHDSGNVLLLAFGATACPLYNFNNALSAGGLKISFDLDPNSHTDFTDTTTWGAVTLGASLVDRHTGVNGAGTHFGILFRANGGMQAFDGSTQVDNGSATWAAAGDYSGQIHRFDIVLSDPGDGNPFNGSGDTQIDVYVDGAATPFFTWTKVGGYADNYIAFQGDHIADLDNLAITQLNPVDPPAPNMWSFAPWSDDGSSGVVDPATGIQYTHAYNISPSRDAFINNVMFTRVWSSNPSVPGRFGTTGLPNSLADDPDGAGGAAPTLACAGSTNLANDFVYGGNPATFTLNGLVPGRQYVLSFLSTTWGGQGGRVLLFSADSDQRAIDQNSFSGRNGITISYAYTATAESMTVTVTPLDGNNTFHCYGFCNRETTPAANPWSYSVWTDDATSGVGPLYNYTHAYSFNSSANATINAIVFTGVAGVNPTVSDQFTTSGFGSPYANDGGNTVTGGGRALANDFVYGGDPATLTLQGLTVGKSYVLSLFSTAWEGPANRFITFGGAGGLKMVDQDVFYANARNGIVLSYAYTADSSGTVTVQTTPLVAGNSFHCYGFANREAELKPLPPIITLQPQGVYVAEGQNVNLTANAIANPAPSFFWLSNGVPMLDQTAATLSFTPAAPAYNGDYQLVASNSGGSITSQVASVRVGLPMPNSSFEADIYTNNPGYLYLNFPISGWSFSGSSRLGINPGAWGNGPFADNGITPHGNQVLFIRDAGTTLDQIVSDFTPGNTYYLVYYENARNCCGGVPAVEVTIDDGVNPPMVIVPKHPVATVGANNPYQLIQSIGFTAGSPNIKVSFTKSDWIAGDSTLLLDSVCFFAQPAGISPAIEIQPQGVRGLPGSSAKFSVVASGSPNVTYQWYKNDAPVSGATAGLLEYGFLTVNEEGDYKVVVSNSSGSITSDVVHLMVLVPLIDLFNTGVDAGGAVLPDGTVDGHYFLTVNPDNATSLDAIVEDTTKFPIVSGPWIGVNTSSKWIGPRLETSAALGGDYTYSTFIDLTGRDLSTVFIEGYWASDNAGTGIAVNGVDTGITQDGDFSIWHYFRLANTNASFSDGVNFIDFKVKNTTDGYTGLRVQIAASHGQLLAGVPPIVAQNPQGTQAALGDTVVLSSIVVGGAPLYFQWKKDGQPLEGQTNSVLTLAHVSLESSGNYTLEASNGSGTTNTQPAFVLVNRERVPGIFGTGVDNAGQLLSDGAAEPHYILTSSADPNYPNAVAVNSDYPIAAGTWVLNGPSSRWIAPQANQNDNYKGGNAEGDYTYSTAFDLTGVDLSRFSLVGGWATDNAGLDVVVNGTSTGFTTSGNTFNHLTPLTITSGLVDGINIIDFIVHNDPVTPNPTGLRVDLAGYLSIKPLTIVHSSANEVTVSWTLPAWKLQWANSLTSPNWQTIPDAVSPFKTNTVDNPLMFFRLSP